MRRRSRRPVGNLLRNVHLAAWIARRLARMRRGRAPWTRTVSLRAGRRW
jgi:hypothetical protein